MNLLSILLLCADGQQRMLTYNAGGAKRRHAIIVAKLPG